MPGAEFRFLVPQFRGYYFLEKAFVERNVAKRAMRAVEEAAKWMKEKVSLGGFLYQEDTVIEIQRRFGDEFVYEAENGSTAINSKILAAFKKITGETVVYDRQEKGWRLRQECDEPGRGQRG